MSKREEQCRSKPAECVTQSRQGTHTEGKTERWLTEKCRCILTRLPYSCQSFFCHILCGFARRPVEPAHPEWTLTCRKSASKRLKSSHTCGFPAENAGAGPAVESLKRCQTGPKQCQISLISLRIETVRGFSERQCPQSEMIEARRMDVRLVRCNTSNNASILASGPRSPSPTGICPLAQGWCEERAPTLGNGKPIQFNPNGVVSRRRRLIRQSAHGHNPVRVGGFRRGRFPGVGRRSSGQPWARGHNPVGIEAGGRVPSRRCFAHQLFSKGSDRFERRNV